MKTKLSLLLLSLFTLHASLFHGSAVAVAAPPTYSFELQQRNAAGDDWIDRTITPQPNSLLAFDANRVPTITLLSTLAKTTDLSQYALTTTLGNYALVTTLNSATTALTTQLAAKAAASDLIAHLNNKSNPHTVTAAQIGLGNVNNTSDTAKPVSTAQQAAIDAAKNAAITQAATSATQYALPARLGPGSQLVEDFDKAIRTGYYRGNDAAHAPCGGWALVFSYNVFEDSSSWETPSWTIQYGGGLDGEFTMFRKRNAIANQWTDWTPIVTIDAPADGKRYVRKNNAWVSLD